MKTCVLLALFPLAASAAISTNQAAWHVAGETNRFDEFAGYWSLASAPSYDLGSYSYALTSPPEDSVFADNGAAGSVGDTLQVTFSTPMSAVSCRVWTLDETGSTAPAPIRVSADGQSVVVMPGFVGVTGGFQVLTFTSAGHYIDIDDLVTTDAAVTLKVSALGGLVRVQAATKAGHAVSVLAADAPGGPWSVLTNGVGSVTWIEGGKGGRFFKGSL